MKTVMANLNFLQSMSIPSDMPEEGCYVLMSGFKGIITRAELQAMIDQARSVSAYTVCGTGGSGGGGMGSAQSATGSNGSVGGFGGGAAGPSDDSYWRNKAKELNRPISVGGFGTGNGAFTGWLFPDGHSEQLPVGETPVWPKVDAAQQAGSE